MAQFTPRVAARTVLAKRMRDNHLPRAIAVGITAADLDSIITAGTAAALADAEQQEQLAAAAVDRAGRKADKEALFQKEDALRSRALAVVGDLRTAGHANLALWLERLSFARYRFREIAPEEPTGPADPANPPVPPVADDEDIRRVTRVRREDVPTRAGAIAALCRALLKPGREPIVAAFQARGLAPADIEDLARRGEAIAEAGRNQLAAAEATQRESDAVTAQKTKWNQIRRMIRNAVAGVPELESKFAEC